MGGGWCWDIQNCYDRSKTYLGSTNVWWPRPLYDFSGWGGIKEGGGYLSSDYKVNHLMWNWNKVFLIYCDGGSFSGNNMTKIVYNETEIYFRGFLNLKGFKVDLDEKHNFYNATDVVISGTSAGGLATYLHLDWWRSQIGENTKVIGLPDSGFFIDYNPLYSTKMRWLFDQMNCSIGLNDECIKSNYVKSNCIFPEYMVPYIHTPFFAIQSMFDTWQLGLEGFHKDNIKEINNYGLMFKERFNSVVLNKNRNGIFLDSCYHHCGGWNDIIINNTNVSIAFQMFYNSNQTTKEYIQNESHLCEKCCFR
jgi:hypothetical protein